MILSVKNIVKNYDGFTVLNDVSFVCDKGEITGIGGPNGSGKTTILNILSSYTPVSGGEIFFKDIDITNLSTVQRARMGITRTHQNGRIFPQHSVAENVLISFLSTNSRSIYKSMMSTFNDEKKNEIIREVLESVGLSKMLEKRAGELSFGQKRRLEFARTLVHREEKSLFLFDEPTTGVDIGFVEVIEYWLKKLRDEGKTIILVEHNVGFMKRIVDKLIILTGGKILLSGSPSEVLSKPIVKDSYLGVTKSVF